MHYKNGRQAHHGDEVVNLSTGQTGIIYAIQTLATTCNARLAVKADNNPYVTLGDCVHIDDIKSAFTEKPK